MRLSILHQLIIMDSRDLVGRDVVGKVEGPAELLHRNRVLAHDDGESDEAVDGANEVVRAATGMALVECRFASVVSILANAPEPTNLGKRTSRLLVLTSRRCRTRHSRTASKSRDRTVRYVESSHSKPRSPAC